MDAIKHAASVLRMFEIEPAPLDRLLESYLRKQRQIGSRERRLVAKAVYGVARWRPRIDGCLELAGVKDPDDRRRAELYLRWHPCEDFERLKGSLALDPALDDVPFEPALGSRGFPGGEAAYHGFPEFLFALLEEEYGPAAARELALVLNEPLGPTLRVNPIRATREEAAALLAELGIHSKPTLRSPYGLRLAIRVNFRDLAPFRDGTLEAQDEASQLVALLASPRPGSSVLDLCAGAGGKGLMMAMLMNDEGKIVASDVDPGKLSELKKRAARSGVKSIRTLEAGKLKSSPDRFDLVLVDAPCSGSGTLRRSPDLKWRMDPDSLGKGARLQAELLGLAAKRVKPGGMLLYATCSILRQENEDVVRKFLASGGFDIVNAGKEIADRGVDAEGIVTGDGYLKTDPRAGDWDCLFCALLRKA